MHTMYNVQSSTTRSEEVYEWPKESPEMMSALVVTLIFFIVGADLVGISFRRKRR